MAGKCSECGSPIFTKAEEKRCAKLSREVIDKLRREDDAEKLPKCFERVRVGNDVGVAFCDGKPKCHFTNDPYTCDIPHYIRHLLLLDHDDDLQ